MIFEFGKPNTKKKWERRFGRFLRNLGVDDPVYVRKNMSVGDVSFEMLLDVSGKLEGDLIYYGHYESHLQQLFSEFENNGGVIMDIGANIGFHSLYLAHSFPQAEVFAFEASPRVFKDLNLNLSLNKCDNLNIFNLPLGAQSGEMVFYEPSGKGIENRGLGSFNPENVPENFTEVILQVNTVDAVIAERLKEGSKVSMMKIDVQGHECEVLDGAVCCLSEHRPVIFMELEMANFDSPMKALDEFRSRFEELNYSAYRISNSDPTYVELSWADIGSMDKFDALLLPD